MNVDKLKFMISELENCAAQSLGIAKQLQDELDNFHQREFVLESTENESSKDA